jgi:long-chain acyl-CoA synthetase
MADSIPSRLLAHVKIRPSSVAYYARRGDLWQPTTWRRFVEEVRLAARALAALGFAKGDRVAILGVSRPEWTIFDHAAMMAGGVPAGIYTTCSAEEVHYIVAHSEAKVVLVENQHQLDKVLTKRAELPALVAIVMMRGAQPGAAHPDVLSWEQFEARAQEVDDQELTRRVELIQDDDLATLIYTSGTTGPPKAVMLSQRNLCWTADQLVASGGGTDHDCSISYLPLSHIAEQMATIHLPATAGSTVYYAESLERLADNIKTSRPTVFFGVPRIWEKFHAGLSAKLDQASGFKRVLLRRAREVCAEVYRRSDAGLPLGRVLRLQYAIAQRLVTNKIKAAIGFDRITRCVTSAAPISREILEFFVSIDIPLQELYGQSEVTGPTSLNMPGACKLGTVGRPLPGVEVKLGDDGEVLVRGPNVFLGYLKDDVATREALQDGWLHSGDLGAVDSDGYLSITGRKKEIIITSGGKNISPRNIEEAIERSTLVGESMVVGDRRKFLTALVTLDEEAVTAFHGAISSGGDAEGKVRQEVQRVIDEANRQLARVEQVKRFTILPKRFSIDGGELTPTLKIRRSVVVKKYHAEIEAMYAGADPS